MIHPPARGKKKKGKTAPFWEKGAAPRLNFHKAGVCSNRMELQHLKKRKQKPFNKVKAVYFQWGAPHRSSMTAS